MLLDPSLSSWNEHTLVFYHRRAFRKTIDVVEKILDVVRNVLDTRIDLLKVILVHSDNTFHCFRHGLKLSPLLGILRFRELCDRKFESIFRKFAKKKQGSTHLRYVCV